MIKYDDKKALFLATDIVATDYGDGIEKWLNEEFLHKITASGEKLYSDEGLRLLSLEESKALSEDIMKLGSQWWLADKRGSLQTTVREDGTVYLNGYNNRRFSKGVRPVLILNEKRLEEILSK